MTHVRAMFETLECSAHRLVIRDTSIRHGTMTVTNDAEQVVAALYEVGKLPAGRRLFYYDTDGEYAELVHREGVFVRFAPAEERNQGGRDR